MLQGRRGLHVIVRGQVPHAQIQSSIDYVRYLPRTPYLELFLLGGVQLQLKTFCLNCSYLSNVIHDSQSKSICCRVNRTKSLNSSLFKLARAEDVMSWRRRIGFAGSLPFPCQKRPLLQTIAFFNSKHRIANDGLNTHSETFTGFSNLLERLVRRAISL